MALVRACSAPAARLLASRGASRIITTDASRLPQDGLTLKDFVAQSRHPGASLVTEPASPSRGGVFMETYGCQMNGADSEVVLSILAEAGWRRVDEPSAASVVLLNTCAIRDNAEAKVWQRLGYYRSLKRSTPRGSQRVVVGVLGCMAERLKQKLLESDRMVDLVAGPDAYRDLPRLIDLVGGGSKALNVQLSADETYADVAPLRRAGERSAYLSIMRGCNNMCAFCIVPYVRGRERSRPIQSILEEVRVGWCTGTLSGAGNNIRVAVVADESLYCPDCLTGSIQPAGRPTVRASISLSETTALCLESVCSVVCFCSELDLVRECATIAGLACAKP